MNVKRQLLQHKILTAVIASYALMLATACWYMEAFEGSLEWASLLFLCPLLLGIAAGMLHRVRLHPEKCTSIRPQLLIATCIVTSGICIAESAIGLWAQVFS